jgi:arylsulfatase A-like enzyme
LIENGVRFVQLYDWGWDHHGSSPGESIDETLPIKCQQIDRAISGLLMDLEQRGLLDDTLVIWGGEFGRTPMLQNNVRAEFKKGFVGRDHHPFAYTMWLAGGGIREGLAFGQTDEFGYYPVENPVSIRDLQATVLHQLGLDPHRFHYKYQGLDQRLIGPTEEGRVLREILS